MYRLEDHVESATRFAAWPGVAEAAATLGYKPEQLMFEAARYPEVVYMLSTFCLTPPGDTPKRRGFIDALLMGCVCREPSRCT
jgi:hypothetical protein